MLHVIFVLLLLGSSSLAAMDASRVIFRPTNLPPVVYLQAIANNSRVYDDGLDEWLVIPSGKISVEISLLREEPSRLPSASAESKKRATQILDFRRVAHAKKPGRDTRVKTVSVKAGESIKAVMRVSAERKVLVMMAFHEDFFEVASRWWTLDCAEQHAVVIETFSRVITRDGTLNLRIYELVLEDTACAIYQNGACHPKLPQPFDEQIGELLHEFDVKFTVTK